MTQQSPYTAPQPSTTQQNTQGESFMQRQRRLRGGSFGTAQPQTQMTPLSTTGNQPPSTPVTGTGKIPDPPPQAPFVSFNQTAQQQPQQQPAPQQAPAPEPPRPPGIPGDWVHYGNGGWAPPTHPAAQQQQAATTAQQSSQQMPAAGAPNAQTNPAAHGTTLQRAVIPNDPIATYGATQFNVPIPELGHLQEISQFQSPQQQALMDAQNQLLQQILANPETLNPQVLGQLKEIQKEQALLMEKQGLQMAQDNAASRGMTKGGGLQSLLSSIQGEAGNEILRSNRDLDVAALQHNRNDQLNALAAAEAAMSGQMNRATQGYGAQLAGQQASIQRALAGHDAGLASAGMNLQQQGMTADERFRQHQSERSAQDAVLQRVLSQFGIDQALVDSNRSNEALQLQRELGHGGLSLDQQRLAQQGSQFDRSFGLDSLRFLEGQRQHDNSLGLGYNQLNMSGQNNLINQILGMLR